MTPLLRAAPGTNRLPTRRSTRRVAALALASALAVAACGGDDDDDAAAATTAETAPESAAPSTESPSTESPSTESPATSEAPATSAPAASSAPATSEADAPATSMATDSTQPVGEGQAINVDLMEFQILLDAEIAAGPVTFNIENTGQFPHNMYVFRGAYADLPQKASGAVDDAAVPAADLLGFVEPVDPGTSTTLSVEFTPGTYTLVCNLEGGGSSHAARGQIVEVVIA